MLIEDSISLEKVPYKFNIDIEENVDEIKEIYEESYLNGKNILDLKKKMRDFGALGTVMSGSGPSVVGIFPDEMSAAMCADALLKSGVWAYYSK